MASSASLTREICNAWMAKNKEFNFPSPSANNSRHEHENEYEDRIQILRQKWDTAIKSIPIHLHVRDNSVKEEEEDMEEYSETNSDSWFDKIVAMHSEKFRHYHTLCHLEEIFGFVDLVLSYEVNQLISEFNSDHKNDHGDNHDRGHEGVIRQSHQKAEINEGGGNAMIGIGISTISEWTAVIYLAIFFHDIVYDAKSSTNEEDSAQLFQSFVTELLNSGEVIDPWWGVLKVHQFIMATKTHTDDISTEHEQGQGQERSIKTKQLEKIVLRTFLDADMAVLGKDQQAYDHYASLIRLEYIHVPKDAYCEKRADILKSFVGSVNSNNVDNKDMDGDENEGANKRREANHNRSKTIYLTQSMRDALEQRAIANLQREIESLENGIIPT